MAKRVFISFDYDNDTVLKEFLVGQSRLPDSPFMISDWSIKVASPGWKEEARRRIRTSDTVAVICGLYTHKAVGVATEVTTVSRKRKAFCTFSSRATRTRTALGRRRRAQATAGTSGHGTT